jgi:hypothetical protein
MKTPCRHSLIAFAAVCALALTLHAADTKERKKQKKIRRMAKDTLQHLCRVIQRPEELAARKVQWIKTLLGKGWFVYTSRMARQFCRFRPGYRLSYSGGNNS